MKRMVSPVKQQKWQVFFLSLSRALMFFPCMTPQSLWLDFKLSLFQGGSHLHRVMDRSKSLSSPMSPRGIKIFLLSGTLQLWNSSMHSEHWKRCEWKWSRYLRHPLVLHWYSQKEKPVVWLPAEGALKQWPYLKYWPLSDYKSVWSCQNLEGEMCCEGRTIISTCIISFCARLALY